MKTKWVAMALIFMGLGSCCKPVPVPTADGGWDGASEVTVEEDAQGVVLLDDCARACATMRLASIRCPEADPTDSGDSCEVLCRHVQTTGLTDLKPKCIASAKTVEEVRACATVRCKR